MQVSRQFISFEIVKWIVDLYFLECGGTLQKQSGTIHGYPSMRSCEWRIITNPGEVVVLTREKFILSSDCENNYVEVRNGYGPKSSLIGKYCGNDEPPKKITSTGNRLLIRMKMKMKRRSKKHKFIFRYKGK